MAHGFRAVVVVPTIREDSIVAFLSAWEEEFRPHQVIVVEDNPEKSFALGGANLVHLSWMDIESELGPEAWIIPRRTDCIRSFGYWKALQLQPDMIITLDDDCYPLDQPQGFLQTHWDRLNQEGSLPAWTTTLEGVVPRGVPYFQTARRLPCILNHGLWESVPDFDAPTQLVQSRQPGEVSWRDQTIPVGCYFPMCGMNLAFRPEAVPALYFLLMGRDYEFDRFGDIWAGVILKKIADHLGYCINSGRPAVKHLRASNVWANLRKEAAGLEVNESFWLAVDHIRLSGATFGECYHQIAEQLPLQGEYWDSLRRAMRTWIGLCGE